MATFDEVGRQVPDQRPVEVPVGFGRAPSLQDEIKRFVRAELSLAARSQQLETFEEADDFEVEDELEEFDSPYEVKEMVPELGDVDGDPPATPKERAPAKKSAVDGNGASAGSPDVEVKADSPPAKP